MTTIDDKKILATLQKHYAAQEKTPDRETRNFRGVSDYLSKLTQFREETTIRRLAYMVDISEPAARAVCKIFEELGLGSLIVGRRGAETRFRWHRHPKSIGLAGRGEGNIEEIDETVESGGDDEDAPAASPAAADDHTWVARFPLRADYTAELRIPRDITREEAEHLGDHVRTLFFRSSKPTWATIVIVDRVVGKKAWARIMFPDGRIHVEEFEAPPGGPIRRYQPWPAELPVLAPERLIDAIDAYRKSAGG